MWLKQSSPKKRRRGATLVQSLGLDGEGAMTVDSSVLAETCWVRPLLQLCLIGLFVSNQAFYPCITPHCSSVDSQVFSQCRLFLLCSSCVPPLFLLPPSSAHTIVLCLCLSPLSATLTPVQSVQLSLLGPPLTTLKSDQSVTGVSHQSHLLDPSYE